MRLCELLAPLLVTKREHAELMLRYVQHRLEAPLVKMKPTDSAGCLRPAYTGIEEDLYLQMKQLNKRGRT